MTLSAQVHVMRDAFCLDVALRAEPGEVVAVLGPNGAGKSTLLRSIAGLVPESSGAIELDGRRLDLLAPHQRQVGIVFQDYRLFPHLSARENVAFPLRSRGSRKGRAHAVADDWLCRLGLGGLEERKPQTLSGGQQQRVALARALSSQPGLLLLDEPLAALDAATRPEVRAVLQRQLAGFSGPTLLVTHDPLEALVLADRLVILEAGRVVQDASPTEVVRRPATTYVARLVGLNLLRGTAQAGTLRLEDGGQVVTSDRSLQGSALAVIRPSSLVLHTEQPHGSSARNVFQGVVTGLEVAGDRVRATVGCTPPLVADLTTEAVADLRLSPGTHVWLSVKATDVDGYAA